LGRCLSVSGTLERNLDLPAGGGRTPLANQHTAAMPPRCAVRAIGGIVIAQYFLNQEPLIAAGSGTVRDEPTRRVVMNDLVLFPDSDGKHRKLLMMIEVGALLAVVTWLVAAREDGPQVALIPTLVTVVASRFFGKKKDDEDGALGEHPAVAFMLGA
jgi:hypothetical protein